MSLKKNPAARRTTAAAKTTDNTFLGCPETGLTAGGNLPAPHQRESNKLKNRNTAPASINAQVTLDKMLKPGSDKTRFKNTFGATITGFLANAARSDDPGGESCNCHSANPNLDDFHLDLVADKTQITKSNRVIVEITPRWRARLGDFGKLTTLQALAKRKAKVRVTGWMFFDEAHTSQADNTKPGSAGNWRATCWEIHPVTRFAVLD